MKSIVNCLLKNVVLCLLPILTACYLSGCAIAVVGALGAAGASAVDNNSPKVPSLEPKPSQDQTASEPMRVDATIDPLPALVADATEPKIETQLAMLELESTPANAQEAVIEKKPVSGKILNKTSLAHLAEHAWKIIGVRGVSHLNFNVDESVFAFSKTNEFKAFISCNQLAGKFHADDSGHFFLKNLLSSNEKCEVSHDQEVMIESFLLSADTFLINDQMLLIGTQGQSLLALVATDHTVRFKDLKKKKTQKKMIINKTH